MNTPDFLPLVPMTDPLGVRLLDVLRRVEGDEAVEDLIWEAEGYHAMGDYASLEVALELLEPLKV